MDDMDEMALIDYQTSLTDLERFILLYRSFGIELVAKEFNDIIYIEMYNTDNPKLKGDSYFLTNIEFTKQGKFIEQTFSC